MSLATGACRSNRVPRRAWKCHGEGRHCCGVPEKSPWSLTGTSPMKMEVYIWENHARVYSCENHGQSCVFNVFFGKLIYKQGMVQPAMFDYREGRNHSKFNQNWVAHTGTYHSKFIQFILGPTTHYTNGIVPWAKLTAGEHDWHGRLLGTYHKHILEGICTTRIGGQRNFQRGKAMMLPSILHKSAHTNVHGPKFRLFEAIWTQ